MIRVNYSMVGQLPSYDQDYGIARTNWGANPLGSFGSPPKVTREMMPLEATANPRVMHPKLNASPWPTSYAVARTEPKTTRPANKWKNMKKTYITNVRQRKTRATR